MRRITPKKKLKFLFITKSFENNYASALHLRMRKRTVDAVDNSLLECTRIEKEIAENMTTTATTK